MEIPILIACQDTLGGDAVHGITSRARRHIVGTGRFHRCQGDIGCRIIEQLGQVAAGQDPVWLKGIPCDESQALRIIEVIDSRAVGQAAQVCIRGIGRNGTDGQDGRSCRMAAILFRTMEILLCCDY